MADDWEEEGNPWTVRGVRTLFENPWFAVEEYDSINPGGGNSMYGVIRMRKVAVGVLPIEADGTVHMVGQWRFPLERYSWEMPEGGAEPGEGIEETAHRELREETGFRAGKLQPILEYDLSNSVTDERAVLFLATALTPGEAAPEEVEKLKTLSAPFREVLARVIDGRIRDGLTVAAVLRVHHMAVEGELPPALAKVILAK